MMDELYTKVMGIRTRYSKEGSGFPLILLPGFPFSMKLFYRVVPKLSEKFEVYCLDLPGFAGRTKNGNCQHNLDFYSGFLEGFMEKMELGKANLLGYSYGGLISMRFYQNHPEKVNKISFLSTPINGIELKRRTFLNSRKKRIFARLLEKYDMPKRLLLSLFKSRLNKWFYLYYKYPHLRKMLEPKVIDEIYGDMKQMGNEPVIEIAKEFFYSDFTEEFRQLNLSTQVIYGKRDAVVLPRDNLKLAQLLPNSVSVGIPNGNHDVALTCADELSEKLMEFF